MPQQFTVYSSHFFFDFFFVLNCTSIFVVIPVLTAFQVFLCRKTMAHGKTILIMLFFFFLLCFLIISINSFLYLQLKFHQPWLWYGLFSNLRQFGLFISDGSFPMKRIKKKYWLQLPRLLQITASKSPCSYTSDIAYFRWPMLGEFDPVFIVFWLIADVFPSNCCEEQSSEPRCD